MSDFVYRLQLLLEQKEEAKERADREVTRREELLRAQVRLLEEMQQRRVQLVEKREKLRRELFFKPSNATELSGTEIQRRSDYIKAMAGQIEEADNEILTQQGVTKEHEAQVQEAKEQARKAHREVEVLTKHREKQKERFVREEMAKEELALDEIGNVLYATRRRST